MSYNIRLYISDEKYISCSQRVLIIPTVCGARPKNRIKDRLHIDKEKVDKVGCGDGGIVFT